MNVPTLTIITLDSYKVRVLYVIMLLLAVQLSSSDRIDGKPSI